MKRKTAIDGVSELPSKFELEDLFEKFLVIEKIENGLAEVKNGESIAHESVVKYIIKNGKNNLDETLIKRS